MSFIQTRQIHAWLGDQGSQLGDKVQRRRAAPLEYDMSGTVAVRCLQLATPPLP